MPEDRSVTSMWLDKLREEWTQPYRDALDEIVDDLSVPARPPAWAAHALEVAQEALAKGGTPSA